MTDITFFSPEELGLLKRVLSFATNDVPITDLMGNRLFPTVETRKMALDLENRLEEAGVATPGTLFSPYDPLVLEGKIATVRWFSDDAVEYNVRGKVKSVEEVADKAGEASDGQWNPISYRVIFADGGTFFFKDRDELQKNSRVELEQELQ